MLFVRMRAAPFQRLLPQCTEWYRTGQMPKNVDYAAYEYNVYVQCNATIVRGKKNNTE